MSLVDLPKSIRVGYRDYAVEAWEPKAATGAQRYGEFAPMEGVIRLRSDLPPQLAAECLLHEVLHGVYANGCAAEADEEKLVSIFANQLTQVWRDNPDFVSFMTESLR